MLHAPGQLILVGGGLFASLLVGRQAAVPSSLPPRQIESRAVAFPSLEVPRWREELRAADFSTTAWALLALFESG